MTTKELRQGNKIMWFNTVTTVAAILTDDFIQCENLDADRKIEEFSPIPLTSEILEKARFNVGENNKFTIEMNLFGSFILQLTVNEYWLEDCDYQTKPIKYVHQLQNLYFELTGEELALVQVSDTTMSN